MIIYRGDNIYKSNNEKTVLENHIFAGLLAKAASGGHPYSIYNNLLPELIRKHIAPQNEDAKYYNTTDFLSFSSDFATAIKYSKGKYNTDKKYIETDYKHFANCVFEFNITEKIETNIKGVYELSYKCDYPVKIIDFEHPLESGDSDFFTGVDIETRWHIKQTAKLLNRCPICNNKKDFLHKIVIIDCVNYLNSNRQNLKDAIFKAERDNEWLVLPFDIRKSGEGLSSTIPRSKIWSIRYYNSES